MKLKSTQIMVGALILWPMYQNAIAQDLSTSCAPVKTISSNSTEMWVEISNQCGQCANISANYTFNGAYQALAGTWYNVPPGGANKYRMSLDKGSGTYQAVVVKVETCH